MYFGKTRHLGGGFLKFNFKNKNMSQKTKCIEITTTENLGFQEMSGMMLEIRKLVNEYEANYEVNYFFKRDSDDPNKQPKTCLKDTTATSK